MERMRTTISITLEGKDTPFFTAGSSRRLTEEEIHEIVMNEGVVGLDPDKCKVEIYHNF